MAQSKKVTLSEVRVGVLVVVSVAILVVAIFFISGKGGIFAARFHVKTYLPAASGLKEGAPVWLAGVEIGKVDTVAISSSLDPLRAVEITMSIRNTYQKDIRTDSKARLGSIGLLGDKYIELSRGLKGTPVGEGGTVEGSEEADIKKLVESSNDLLANLDVLSDKVKSITEKIDKGEGSVGKFINDPTLYNNVSHTVQVASDLMDQMKRGQGSIGKLLVDTQLYDHFNVAAEKLNRIADRLEAGQGTVGKLFKDESLYNNLNETVAKSKAVVSRIEKGEGTLGKLAADQELYNKMNHALDRITAITDKIDHGEGTVGRLMNDKELYNNLNAASAEVVKLIYDFRMNPKRFLTIKFKVF
jgi:phospholipid/cholesterol/gamma-HCH transport system substrate-binding protein